MDIIALFSEIDDFLFRFEARLQTKAHEEQADVSGCRQTSLEKADAH